MHTSVNLGDRFFFFPLSFSLSISRHAPSSRPIIAGRRRINDRTDTRYGNKDRNRGYVDVESSRAADFRRSCCRDRRFLRDLPRSRLKPRRFSYRDSPSERDPKVETIETRLLRRWRQSQ